MLGGFPQNSNSLYTITIVLLLALLRYAACFKVLQYHPPDVDQYHYAAIKLEDPDHVDLHRLQLWHPVLKWTGQLPSALSDEDERQDSQIRLKMYHYHSRARKIQNYLDDHSMEIVGQIGALEGHYLVRWPIQSESQNLVELLEDHPHVQWSLYQKPKVLSKRGDFNPKSLDYVNGVTKGLGINDPGFGNQWHLVNRANREADVNVTDVWAQGITGAGVTVAVIDDGVDANHEDLKDNFCAEGSYDFNARTKLPLPRLRDDYHGTRCAGEIAAVPNSVCGVGVAYGAKVSGLRILGGPITDVDEAIALNYGNQINDIYSCSWGPSDDGQHCEGPNELVYNAILKGIKNGRGGKGSLFVFATGNGGYFSDNCNYDGYTNSMYTISIGAIDQHNDHPQYSEQCSAHLAVTYSSGGQKAIFTTDIGASKCTSNHGGTSAAAPIGVGILALVLSVRKDLTWRDVQHLTIRGAVPFRTEDPDGDWQQTYAGRWYSHKFAYGKLDAYTVVEAAKNWTLVNKGTKFESKAVTAIQPIPNNEIGLNSTITITQADIEAVKMKRLEHVTVTVTIDHECRGDLDIVLISPNNIVSNIGPRRPVDRSKAGFKNWTFLTVKHWEENPVGTWTLRITDNFNPASKGVLKNWFLTLHGESENNHNEPVSASDENGQASDEKDKDKVSDDNWAEWVTNYKTPVGIFISIVVLALIGSILIVRKAKKSKAENAQENIEEAFMLEETQRRSSSPLRSPGTSFALLNRGPEYRPLGLAEDGDEQDLSQIRANQ